MIDLQSYAARRPSGKVFIGDVAVPVQSVTLYHTINQLPYAEFTVALDSNPGDTNLISVGGVQISIAGINQLGKLLQEKFYNSFTLSPDTKLLVDDGGGNVIDFRGFLVNPQFEVEGGRFLMNFTMLHSMVRLQAFNAGIYSNVTMYGTTGDTYNDSLMRVYNTFNTDGDLVTRDDSVMSRVNLLLNMVLNNYENEYRSRINPDAITQLQNTENGVNPEFEPAMWNIHALNKKLLDAVVKVCTRSKIWTEIQGLSDGQGHQNPHWSDAAMHRQLFDILFGSASLLDAFSMICNTFMFQMNAHWNDTIWLEHTQTMEIPYSMIVTPVGALQFSLSSMFEIPLLQVIARGPASDLYSMMPTTMGDTSVPLAPTGKTPDALDAQQLRDQSTRILVRYPSRVPKFKGQVMPGRYMYVDAPQWLGWDENEIQSAAITGPSNPNTIDIATAGNDIHLNAIANQQSMVQKRLDTGTQRMNFLRYIAKYFFKENYLARATARVRVPMTFLPQVGRTYFLRESGQDKSIYIGYLQSVAHTLVLEEGHGVADTQLVFSHIISRDANLLPVVLGDAEDGTDTAALLNQREAELVAQIVKPPFPPRSPCEPEETITEATGQTQSAMPVLATVSVNLAAAPTQAVPSGPSSVVSAPVTPATQPVPSTTPSTQPATAPTTPAVPVTPIPAPTVIPPSAVPRYGQSANPAIEAAVYAQQQAAKGTAYADQQADYRARDTLSGLDLADPW